MLKDKFVQAYDKIKQADNILLVTHNKPDGDAVSSVCAFIEFLSNLEKKYTAYCYDPAPKQFNFLPHVEKIIYDKKKFNFSDFDLIIVFDCGGLSRTKLDNEILNKADSQYIIEFDHHPKIDDYADLEIRIPKSSSTAEVLYDFFKANNIRLNKNLANCILAGILTDTGNFLYPSTTDKTVKIGSEMLIYGARFPTIIENTWRNKTLPGMKFWGKAINNLKINKTYNFAYTVLTYADIVDSGVTDEEFDGIAGFLSSLHGVNGLLVLREEEPGKIKGSLRTAHPKIDISKLAKVFVGGGGHPKASGFALEGSIEKTEQGWKVV